MFLRAALGFEKDIMQQAGTLLAEAEDAAVEHQRRAVRDPSTAHQSHIYPPGAEYALIHAETQLMSAVVAVLNESVTESLRGFYKMRRAFGTLSEISAAEKKYLDRHPPESKGSSSSSTDSLSSGHGQSEPMTPDTSDDDLEDLSYNEDEDDDLEFVDAKDVLSALVTPIGYDGHLEFPDFTTLKLHDTNSKSSNDEKSSSTTPEAGQRDADDDIDFRTITTNPIDLFIHSGTALCFGLLQLLLSMIPPAFSRLLSIFSFRGDRENGFRLLYSATRFKHNINGAMAGLIYLGFHNGAIAFCDILHKGALPEARLRSLLAEMREIYPKSKLWLLEESRMLTRDRKLEQAVDTVKAGPKSSLKQVEALATFETSLNLMYLHRYEECAASFIRCVGLNNWSHALYYYIAGACHVELYRIHQTSDPDKAKLSAAKAAKYLREVPMHTAKKKFMGRQLPFDVFVGRKIQKWEARAKQRHCDFVDAVGVSPLVEMTYFWNGPTRMRPDHLANCLDRLAWSEQQATWPNEPVDEHAIYHLLRGVCRRNLGHLEEAQSIYSTEVLSHELHRLKACDHPDTWPLPVANYEMAVCYWKEAGGETGDRATLKKCSESLAKVEKWESFELEARIGLKITTARETLKRCGIES